MSKRSNVLRSKVQLLARECDAWLDDMAHAIKEQDGPNLPFGTVRNTICRGECRCAAVLRLTDEN